MVNLFSMDITYVMACQKKSYLICDEITNFQIFTKPMPKFFFKYKTETAKTGQRQLLEKKYYILVFKKFVISSHIK